ncbi:MAG: DUF302 domain-containing protein [Myxococcota bacterium]
MTMRDPRPRHEDVEFELADTADFLDQPYAHYVNVPTSRAEVLQEIHRLLEDEGFHTMIETELDQELGRIMGAHMRPFTLLGIWKPSLAHRAAMVNAATALMLPFNIAVQELEEERVRVWIPDAEAMYAQTGDGELESIAMETQASLERILGYLRDIGR